MKASEMREKLIAFFNRHAVSQARFAALAGITQNTISNIMQCKFPERQVARKTATAINNLINSYEED